MTYEEYYIIHELRQGYQVLNENEAKELIYLIEGYYLTRDIDSRIIFGIDEIYNYLVNKFNLKNNHQHLCELNKIFVELWDESVKKVREERAKFKE